MKKIEKKLLSPIWDLVTGTNCICKPHTEGEVVADVCDEHGQGLDDLHTDGVLGGLEQHLDEVLQDLVLEEEAAGATIGAPRSERGWGRK